MRLGVPYQGSKNAIARDIMAILPRGKRFVDLFAGGCAMTHAAILSGKYETFVANDIHGFGVRLFRDAIAGKCNGAWRHWVSREEFFAKRDTDPLISLCWSFSNNGRDYLYAQTKEAAKRVDGRRRGRGRGMKDWTGNSKTAFVTLGASNHSAGERQAHDFYATSPKAVGQLLDAEVFSRDILEPCCGAGHIAKVLSARGYNVKAQDLYDYGYGESGVDFLAYDKPFNGDVITNPPYKYATEFVIHALELIPPPCRVAMFLRLQFLEGAIRYRELFSRGNLERVYVSSRRSHCAMNGDFDNMKGNAICYAWFIWRKGYEGEPTIRWFNTPTRSTL